MKNSKVSGSTLLESMIAVVVLSIGLLGIAMLQIQSKHLAFQAIQRSAASLLTHEIIERMRNNQRKAQRLPDDGRRRNDQ